MKKQNGTLQEIINFVLINEKKIEDAAKDSLHNEYEAYKHYEELYSFYPELGRRSKRVSNLIEELNNAQLDLCAYIKTFRKR